MKKTLNGARYVKKTQRKNLGYEVSLPTTKRRRISSSKNYRQRKTTCKKQSRRNENEHNLPSQPSQRVHDDNDDAQIRRTYAESTQYWQRYLNETCVPNGFFSKKQEMREKKKKKKLRNIILIRTIVMERTCSTPSHSFSAISCACVDGIWL